MITITDDEAVALAVMRGTAWPTPLPTVDSDDAEALAYAGRRGNRSLVVRELVTVDRDGAVGVSPSLAMLVALVMDGVLSTVAFPATAELDVAPGGFSSYTYAGATPDQWLAEGVGPDGVRILAQTSEGECLLALRELVERALATGVTDSTGALVPLALMRLDEPDLFTVVLAAPAGLSSFSLSAAADGPARRTPHEDPVDASAAAALVSPAASATPTSS